MRIPEVHVGYFKSRIGGALGAIIEDHRILFEVITGGAVYDPSGSRLCGPGWVFAHRQGQQTIHRTDPDGHYACLTLRFEDNDAMREIDWPRAFCWNPIATIAEFSDEILEAYHRTDIDRNTISQFALGQLTFRLAQFRQTTSSTAYPQEIARLTAYIEQFHGEDLTMADLADLCGLSVSHLHARFKESVGMSPHQYLIKQRMRAACHLLVTTGEGVGSIAATVGYANPESFCRAFKQFHGSTAVAYRRQYRRLHQSG